MEELSEFWDHRKENHPVQGWVVVQSSSPPPLRCVSDESWFGPCACAISLRMTHGTTVPVLKKAMWLNQRQPVKVFKSLNDRQSDNCFLEFKESKEHIQFKRSYRLRTAKRSRGEGTPLYGLHRREQNQLKPYKLWEYGKIGQIDIDFYFYWVRLV